MRFKNYLLLYAPAVDVAGHSIPLAEATQRPDVQMILRDLPPDYWELIGVFPAARGAGAQLLFQRCRSLPSR